MFCRLVVLPVDFLAGFINFNLSFSSFAYLFADVDKLHKSFKGAGPKAWRRQADLLPLLQVRLMECVCERLKEKVANKLKKGGRRIVCGVAAEEKEEGETTERWV